MIFKKRCQKFKFKNSKKKINFEFGLKKKKLSQIFKFFEHTERNYILVSELTTPVNIWSMTAKDLNFHLDTLKHFSDFNKKKCFLLSTMHRY
jgi:hypothetical protein